VTESALRLLGVLLPAQISGYVKPAKVQKTKIEQNIEKANVSLLMLCPASFLGQSIII